MTSGRTTPPDTTHAEVVVVVVISSSPSSPRTTSTEKPRAASTSATTEASGACAQPTSADVGWSRRARLGLGTGVMGGYTTYSALAADTVTLGLVHPGDRPVVEG